MGWYLFLLFGAPVDEVASVEGDAEEIGGMRRCNCEAIRAEARRRVQFSWRLQVLVTLLLKAS